MNYTNEQIIKTLDEIKPYIGIGVRFVEELLKNKTSGVKSGTALLIIRALLTATGIQFNKTPEIYKAIESAIPSLINNEVKLYNDLNIFEKKVEKK